MLGGSSTPRDCIQMKSTIILDRKFQGHAAPWGIDRLRQTGASLVNHVLLPVPTATTKGVLISPTVYGNMLFGPTAEDLPDKTATNTSANGLQSLLEKGKKILPELLEEEVTATYAGLRAATEHSDYQIALHAEQKYICVGGIRSTGISASLGIAEYVADCY